MSSHIFCKYSLIVTLLCMGYLAAMPVLAYEPLFGTKEVPSKNLKPFPKWTGVMERYFDDKKLEDKPCSSTTFNRCHLKEWNNFLSKLKGLPLETQIEQINDYMNKAEYILDPINWGVPDYWATPKQFFNKDGDCEDYAIAKFISLRALEVPNEQMRIVVLQDVNLGAIHAVLVVYQNGKPYVMDNQIEQVIPAEKIFHYRPVYSINEDGWWRHSY